MLEWILDHIDVFDEMAYIMRDWDDDIFSEEYDMLDDYIWENINED